MGQERLQILKMLEEGKINVEEDPSASSGLRIGVDIG